MASAKHHTEGANHNGNSVEENAFFGERFNNHRSQKLMGGLEVWLG
jgi:hypothetical protein